MGPRMRRTLITAAVTATAVAGFGGSAQAALIDTDTLTLNTTGYDFGGAGWDDGVPTGDGELHFHHDNGKIRPHLVGSLHLDDADDTCGRMRLQYYDEAGDWLTTEYGGEVCAYDDEHHSWSVDLDPYADGSIASVRVSVQKEIDSVWYTPHSETFDVGTHADEVKITGNKVDLGGAGWVPGLGEPTSPATMSWILDDDYLPLPDGDVLPALNGYFHVDNLAGQCARVNLRYLTEGGTFLYETHATEQCPSGNAHESYWFSAYPWNSEKIGKVRVQLQIQNGSSWDTEAAKTVSIEE
jgi:hypothetical protein